MRNKNSLRWRIIAAVLSTLALVHAVLLYGLIGENEIAWLTAGALALFLVLRPRTGLLLALSVLGGTLFLAGLLKVSGVDQRPFPNKAAARISYDLLRGHQIYEPNMNITFTVPGGDLRSMTSPETMQDVPAAPHEMRFATDSLGYRNDADYAEQQYILVGDSFVVATATDQQDILSAQLLRDHDIRAWNVAAVGGDLADYAHWIAHTRAKVSKDAKILLFFFEGNDFEKVLDRDAALPLWKLWLKRYRNRLRFTGIGKFSYAMVKRYTASPEGEQVTVLPCGPLHMAFFNKYSNIAKRSGYPNPGDFGTMMATVAPEVAGVFFIPAKFRVYRELLDQGNPGQIPNLQYEYLKGLCQTQGLPLVDLTGPLAGEARRLLDQGRTVWYPDDTHWNAAGIAVAAREVAAFITGH